MGVKLRAALVAALVMAGVALVAPAASADIIAATDEFVAQNSFDIALIDTATGDHLALPAGINTTSQELHPSISSDGKRLVFERIDPTTHVVHIIATDLTTGQHADLFNAFDSGQFAPVTPTITPDGKTVITGANSQQAGGGLVPTWIQTDLTNFPTGPFAHTVIEQTNLPLGDSGRTLDPSFDPAIGVHGVIALSFQRFRTPAVPNVVIVSDSGKNANVFEPGQSLSSPALSSAAGVVMFERAPGASPEVDLGYRTLSLTGVPQATTFLLPGVNHSNRANLHPALTADGRYVVFRQQQFTPATPAGTFQSGDVHLLVYDTATQLLLDPTGVDEGSFDMRGVWAEQGGISLFQTFIFKGTQFLFNGGIPSVSFTLSTPSGVGILVQRIVGHHKLFGHRVPRLHKVGRVPFGSFRRGKHRVRWDLRVNGRRLRPGTYLVTPRALTSEGAVRELGRPRILHVRAHPLG